MIGSYDYCGHYEFTFQWLESLGGVELVREYWLEAISIDAQRHAREIIIPEGLAGMKKYWSHSLEEEAAGYAFTSDEKRFRIDMHVCPSKGFLMNNGLEQYSDYCDHCLGWIGPMMKDAGFVVDHEHDHCGMCWWEFRKNDDLTAPSAVGEFAGDKDVRLQPAWNSATLDVFHRVVDDRNKCKQPSQVATGSSPVT